MQVIPRYRRSSIVAAEGGTPAHHLGPGVARRRRHQAIPADPAAEGGVPTAPIWWGGYSAGACPKGWARC